MLSLGRAVACLLVGLVVVTGASLGLPGLSINSDARVFFPESNEKRKRLDAFEREYAVGKNLAIAIHSEDGDLFTEERIALLRELTREAWTLPHVTRVESIINAVHIRSQGDELLIEEMGDPVEGPAAELRERALADSLIVGRLLTEDAKTTVVMLNVTGIRTSREASQRNIEAADALVKELGFAEAGLDVWFGGRVASDHAFAIAGKSDLAALLPVAFAIITILLIVVLRSFTFALILAVVPALAAVATLGLAGHAAVEITAMTANIPTIVVALGIAAFLHLIVDIQDRLRSGIGHREAVNASVLDTIAPIALTFATTIIGFLSLNAAESPPLKMLGNLTALGAAFCFVLSMLMIPALVLLLKPKARREWPAVSGVLDTAAGLVTGHRKRLLTGVSLASAVLISGMALMEVNDYFPHFFEESYRYRRDADKLEAQLPAYNAVQFHIATGDDSPVLTPERLGKLAAFEDFLRSQPKVVFTASMAETMRRLHRHLNAGDVPDGPFPDDPDAVAQYTLLYEMSLPFGLDLSNQVTTDKTGTRITAIIRDAKSTEMLALAALGEQWLRDNEVAPISHATGQSALYANITMMNVRSMTSGTLIALVLISFILIFAFRSWRYGLVSLLPNILPAAIAFGIWGVLVGEVGVASSVVGAVTLGIIVDDTIHIIWRYRKARALGLPPELAARQMLHRAGRPILVSSAILALGFGSLLVSGFWITESLGALSAMIIAAALVTDILLLTPLLIGLDSWLEPGGRNLAVDEPAPALAPRSRGARMKSGEQAAARAAG